MSRLLNLSKGTLQGIVRKLLREGFLLQEEEMRKYRPGGKPYELGITSAGSLEFNQRASTPAHELSVSTGMHVRVAIRPNFERTAVGALILGNPGKPVGLLGIAGNLSNLLGESIANLTSNPSRLR